MVILNDQQVEVQQPQSIVSVLQQWCSNLDRFDREKEHFFVVILDTRHKAKLIDVTSIGILNASLVHPREVFARAIAKNAASILIAHNHPSGDCAPSDADERITNRLRQAGGIIGIELVDHIVFTQMAYYSFKEKGLL